MKNQIIKFTALAFAGLALTACDADFSNPVSGDTGSSGTADLSKFVAIGDSLTAGYADGALYLTGQENSYPAILAQQFAKVGGEATFAQPLVSDNLGGLLVGGMSDPVNLGNRLVLNLIDPANPAPEPIAGTPTTEAIGAGLNGMAFNNMGVPGAKSFHLLSTTYGDPASLPAAANPYFVRFASSTTTTMITDAATAQAPSFYVLWAGNNDILSYATTGGVGTDRTGMSDIGNGFINYGSNDITDPLTDFPTVYANLVGAFKAANPNVQGVLINLPDVKSIPFFTTVPFNPVPLDQATADLLNLAYADYNTNVAAILIANPDEVAQRAINFTAGMNAVVILDEDLTDLTGFSPLLLNFRHATAEDLLVLTTSSLIGEDLGMGPFGLADPLKDEHVLIPSEIAAIDAARAAFNTTIKDAADADPNLIHVDAAAILDDVKANGYNYGTGFVDSTYGTGGMFSLDGVHPTARGYAIIANEIIDAINTGFNATIPGVDPGSYTTIFPK